VPSRAIASAGSGSSKRSTVDRVSLASFSGCGAAWRKTRPARQTSNNPATRRERMVSYLRDVPVERLHEGRTTIPTRAEGQRDRTGCFPVVSRRLYYKRAPGAVEGERV